jgi:hypothetical protein
MLLLNREAMGHVGAMKKTVLAMFVMNLFISFGAFAGCHALELAPSDYPTGPAEVDSFCISPSGAASFSLNSHQVYAFQLERDYIASHTVCGGREHDHCGTTGDSTRYSIENDTVSFYETFEDVEFDRGTPGTHQRIDLLYKYYRYSFWI